MAVSNAKKQSNSIYYNIDKYNDNSTNADISSSFSTFFNSPLLMDTSNYEVACVRARVPLDNVPLSQTNIPFQKWQIEIGVPVVGAPPNTYTYYDAFVPQFNQIVTTTANFNIGINGQYMQTTSLPQNEPTTDPTLTLTPKVPQLPYPVAIQAGGILENGVSNTACGLTYTAIITSPSVISRYITATNAFVDSINVPVSISRPNLVLLGLCMPPNSNKVYVLSYDPDGGGSHLLSDIFNFPVGLDLEIPSPQIALNSISCSTTQLSISYSSDTVIPIVRNYDLSSGSITPLNFYSPTAYAVSFIDSDSNYYLGTISGIDQFFTQNTIGTGAVETTYNLPVADPSPYYLDRFLGSDIYGNLLVLTTDSYGNYTILAYGKSSAILRYRINMIDGYRPLVISNMIMTNITTENTAPYAIQTINEYLRQINLAFVDIMGQIPLPLTSPQLTPFLEFNSTTSIVSIVCDAGCWSGTNPAGANPACVINFNQLLFSFFKFNSIAAVYTELSSVGGQVRTIEINKAVAPASSITPQPNSTIYRFADITRLIIGTSRMSVYGDNQNNDKLLINLSDFTIDTERGIPNLIIFNPVILRFYKLYQQTPLTQLDIFVSYANRAGDVFPINISPYNSIGLKLEFHRIPLVETI